MTLKIPPPPDFTDHSKIRFDDIPYEERTVSRCMEVMRAWDGGKNRRGREAADRRIRIFVPLKVRDAVRVQCYLEEIL